MYILSEVSENVYYLQFSELLVRSGSYQSVLQVVGLSDSGGGTDL